MNRLIFAVKVASSTRDLTEFAKCLGNGLPVFFMYLNVALARADVPFNVNDGSKSFKCNWETLLFGFEPDAEKLGQSKERPWICGEIRVRREVTNVVEKVTERRPASKSSKSSASNADKSGQSNSDGPHNSTDSVLEEILNHFPPAQPKDHKNVPKAKISAAGPEKASVAVGTSNEYVRSKIVWRNPHPLAREAVGSTKKPEGVNNYEFRVGVEKMELCGISEVDQIIITYVFTRIAFRITKSR